MPTFVFSINRDESVEPHCHPERSESMSFQKSPPADGCVRSPALAPRRPCLCEARGGCVPGGPGPRASHTTVPEAGLFEDTQSESSTGWQCMRSKEPGAEPLRPRDGQSLQSRRSMSCCRRCAWRARKDATHRRHSHHRARQKMWALALQSVWFTLRLHAVTARVWRVSSTAGKV